MSDNKLNIINTWIKVVGGYDADNLRDAVNKMNDKIGTKYSTTRIREMSQMDARGKRMDRSLRIYMGSVVISHVLMECGIEIEHLSYHNCKKLILMLN